MPQPAVYMTEKLKSEDIILLGYSKIKSQLNDRITAQFII